MNSTTLKSENAYYLRMIALIAGGCVCFVIAYFAFAASIDAPYWQLPEGIGGIALTAGGIACFAYIRNFNTLEIDSKALTVKSVLGSHKKTIALSEITGYTETSHTNKGKTHFELTVYTGTGKHRLLSYAYGNYDDLKALLTTGQRHDTARETELKRNLAWFMGAAFIVIGICMCV
ncbi:MAG TPA: hypothetical protein VK174_15235, partial [Chitinophagales bacterium]|nr:hypothetical protein [Chitinophagales bacterium]